ncbi:MULTISPECIES: type I-G CRISPR-associated protein Cas8g1/Csx17 [Methylomicrobium]|nr:MULTISPECIES: type I-U CRISPR-associated protein Csx17 [Methylomicrobium]
MANEIYLNGCTPVPLAHYLKALGVLRLVSEQKDPDAAGYWHNECFVLRTKLNKDELLGFFLEEYRPTPIVAPWNGGSGFFYQEGKTKEKDPATGKKLKTGVRNQPTEATRTIDAMLNGKAQRFSVHRQMIKLCRQALEYCEFQEAPKNEDKNRLLQIIRNAFPDDFLTWMDAALLIGQDKTFFPPLLGTGGNDGNLDFTNNFMQRLRQLFDLESGKADAGAGQWLDGALFAEATASLTTNAAIGQFFPGGAGGPNGTAGFESGSLFNTWDFILMVEGALLFAATITRRLQQDRSGALSYPFTVHNTGGGSGASSQTDEANARAEIWLPLWRNAATLAELKILFQEGRATLGRRPARDGLEFARAVAGLGVDRGIGEFQRYGFVMRSGKAYLATPFGRLKTQRNPAADLIHDLDKNRFLENLRALARKTEAPGRLVSLTRQLESDLFELVQHSAPRAVQDVLILLGQLQRALSLSAKGREAVKTPLSALKSDWVLKADDGSAEFRLACALANIYAKNLPMRLHFSKTGMEKGGKWVWDTESRLAVWGEGPFERNMVVLLRSRLLAAERMQSQDKPFAFRFGAGSGDIAAFLAQSTDDGRIGDLAQGLALIKVDDFPRHLGDRAGYREQSILPAAYAVLKPFFVEDEVLRKLEFLPNDKNIKLPQPPELLAWLAAGHTGRAVALGWNKLRQSGISLPGFPNKPPMPIGIDGERLLAALAMPVAFGELDHLFRSIARK